MNGTSGSAVLDRGSRALARRFRLVRFLSALRPSGIAAAVPLVVFLLLGRLGIVLVSPWVVLTGYAAVVLAAALVQALATSVRPERLLLAADERYETGELFCTAYEEIVRHPTSRFSRALLQAAEERIGQIEPRRVFPASGGRAGLVPAGIAVAAAAVIVLGLASPAPSAAGSPGMTGTQLRELGSRLAARAAEQSDAESREIARELQELGDQIQEQGFNEKTEDRARTLLPRIEEQVDALSRAQLPNASRDSETLAEVEEQLKAYLSGRRADRDQYQIATPMGSSGNTSPDESAGSGDRRPGGGARESEEGERQGDAGRQQSSGDGSSRENDPGERPPGQSGRTRQDGTAQLEEGGNRDTGSRPEQRGGPQRQAEGERRRGREDSAQRPGAGQQRGAPQGSVPDQGEQQPLAGTDRGAASLLESEIREGEVIRLFMRRLADRAEATLPEREISGSYRRAVEEAMKREQIPAELEALVEDYFVVIGLTDQEAAEGRENEPAER